MNTYIIKSSDVKKILSLYGEKALIFNPEYVISMEQVKFAAKITFISIKKGQNIAKNPAIEFLVRLSGKKQISKALEFGLKKLKTYAGVVLLEDFLDPSFETFEFFPNMEKVKYMYSIEKNEDISKEIYEKMALVDL